MKISLIQNNVGSISSEFSIAKQIENFNGSNIQISENSIIVETANRNISFHLKEFNDGDPIHITYITTFDGQNIRIVKPRDRYKMMLGDTITFASTYGNGFAVHFDIF